MSSSNARKALKAVDNASAPHQMALTVKLSWLLRKLQDTPDCLFLCHLVADHADKKSAKAGQRIRWTTDALTLRNELQRICPAYINPPTTYIGTLGTWLTNVPAPIAKIQAEHRSRPLRITFLEWLIQKVGDKKITLKLNGQ